MQVGATPDLMVAYIDFFLGGDEKRLDIVSIIEKRYPMCIIFGGDGSYMTPYNLHSDALLTNLIGQVDYLLLKVILLLLTNQTLTQNKLSYISSMSLRRFGIAWLLASMLN